MVNMRRGIVAPPVLIDMNGVAELRAIKADARRHRDRRLGHAGRDRRAIPTCSSTIRWWRRRPLHRRPDPSQHGHGRRQSLPRHPLHLLQSERMVARRQQPLPQDHRQHLPRRAEEPRRVLRHLQRRSCAGPADARRRGRHRRPAGSRTLPLDEALYRLRAPGQPVTETQGDGKYYLSLRPGEFVTAVRAKNDARPALGL